GDQLQRDGAVGVGGRHHADVTVFAHGLAGFAVDHGRQQLALLGLADGEVLGVGADAQVDLVAVDHPVFAVSTGLDEVGRDPAGGGGGQLHGSPAVLFADHGKLVAVVHDAHGRVGQARAGAQADRFAGDLGD